MSVIIFIIILAVLIVGHEYGHYWTAKRFGIKVDEFGIGYPPKAKKLFRKNGTDFTLNWIPFGGFVKIYGEDYDATEEKIVDKEKSFYFKHPLKKIAVLFAGPLANIILGFIFILLSTIWGFPTAVSENINEDYVTDRGLVVAEVLPGSPAELVGLEAGDVIRGASIDEKEIPLTLEDFSLNLDLFREPVELNVERVNGTEDTLLVEPEAGEDGRRVIGVSMGEVGLYNPPLLEAVRFSFETTFVLTKNITLAFVNLIGGAFNGQSDIDSLSGPVGIVKLVGDASSMGITFLFYFTALVSINLGILNLVPFPALDGGRILFIAIESVIGKKIPTKVANITNAIGFLILILLMLFITYKDIARLF